MQRLTVSVDEDIAEIARQDVAAGRAESISAWVSDAMRQKALARIQLRVELDELARVDPYTPDTVDWVARVIRREPSWVAEQLGVDLAQPRDGEHTG